MCFDTIIWVSNLGISLFLIPCLPSIFLNIKMFQKSEWKMKNSFNVSIPNLNGCYLHFLVLRCMVQIWVFSTHAQVIKVLFLFICILNLVVFPLTLFWLESCCDMYIHCCKELLCRVSFKAHPDNNFIHLICEFQYYLPCPTKCWIKQKVK